MAVSASSGPAIVVHAVEDETNEGGSRRVPRSSRAAILAGLVVGFVDAGLALRNGAPPSGLAAALMLPHDPAATASAAIAGGLFVGVEGALSSLYLVRLALNALGWAAPLDYALGGGVFAAVYACIGQVGGSGVPQYGWAVAIASGAATAFLFRIFAGAVRL